jgi:hypothetical protein
MLISIRGRPVPSSHRGIGDPIDAHWIAIFYCSIGSRRCPFGSAGPMILIAAREPCDVVIKTERSTVAD